MLRTRITTIRCMTEYASFRLLSLFISIDIRGRIINRYQLAQPVDWCGKKAPTETYKFLLAAAYSTMPCLAESSTIKTYDRCRTGRWPNPAVPRFSICASAFYDRRSSILVRQPAIRSGCSEDSTSRRPSIYLPARSHIYQCCSQ